MEDGAPVGVVRFDFYTDSEAQVFMLVSPAARGRGVGRQLLARALSTTTASICKADSSSLLLLAPVRPLVVPVHPDRP